MKKSVKFISLLLACGMLMSMASCSKKDKEPDAEQIQEQIDTVAVKLEEIKSDKDYEDLDPDEKAELVMDELKVLSKKGYVNADTIYYDDEEHRITFTYGSGVLACDLIDGFEDDVYGATPDPVTYINGKEDIVYNSSRSDRQAKAVILDAAMEFKDVLARSETLAQDLSSEGIETKLDVTVTLDDMCNLQKYSFVFFEMHGEHLYFADKGEELSVIYLQEGMRSKDYKKYQDDLLNGRIGVSTDNSPFIFSSFFAKHYDKGDLSGNVFLISCCQLMGKRDKDNEEWTQVLLECSLSAFIGFHNSVATMYVSDLAECFSRGLINGNTVKDAYDYALNQCGENDEKWRGSYLAAYPKLRGDENALFKWEYDENNGTSSGSQDTTVSSSNPDELYQIYMQNELIPQYGWTSTETSTFCLSVSNGSGFAYNPADSQIEAAGIISADVDDYNGDGVDDLIVIYMYKESANGVDSVYTDSSWFSSPQTEIYRTKLAAFTVSGNNVVKTDEYDVVTYGIDKQNDSLVGCLFPQEQDQKRMTIFKVYKDNTPSILFSNVLNSGPMFRYFCETSWFMGINQNGKFYMKSCYIGGGITNDRYSYLYEFSNGVETSYEEYHNDVDNPGFESPYVTDYYDDHQVSYYEDDYYWSISENNEQVFVAGYDVDITDSDSSNGSYYYSVTFFDGGNLSSELR
ncbi:MAG: hypothetical protein IJL19_08070 [Clostridiales bacterium]|nr:hypothetical protein [Clostridiales bacterium]